MDRARARVGVRVFFLILILTRPREGGREGPGVTKARERWLDGFLALRLREAHRGTVVWLLLAGGTPGEGDAWPVFVCACLARTKGL